MNGIDKAIEKLKVEGYSSEQIKLAIVIMKQEALEQPKISVSLDEYLDKLD